MLEFVVVEQTRRRIPQQDHTMCSFNFTLLQVLQKMIQNKTGKFTF